MPKWLIFDMDEGLLRREPSFRKAVDWCKEQACGAPVIHRTRLPDGGYEYTLGYPGEGRASTFWLETEESATAGGWLLAEPLYPHADRPHEYVERAPAIPAAS